MPRPECFSAAELRAFLLGDLPAHVSWAIAAHLEICGACAAQADHLDHLTDSVICSLRNAYLSSADSAPAPTGPTTAIHNGPAAVPAVDTTRSSLRIAGYMILEELGRGGMSVVYKARQICPDRLVALKMILAGTHAGPERRARFLAEADAIARLQHPGIVQVHEVGEHDGLPFLSLEYLAGGSLAERVRGQPQPPRPAAELVEQVARAVHHAHQQGIVHRDLKPGNILLTAAGQPKVSDFGLAKQERPDLTATGAVLGTPSYMALEQAGGDNRGVGPAADVYALGAILYELLTGRPPFRGATTLETLEQVRNQEPVPPSLLQVRTPRDLNTLCLKCLHKEPRWRYGSAGELADDLCRFRDGLPVKARPVGMPERIWRWGRRNPGWMMLVASVAVLLLVIAVGASVGLLVLGRALSESEASRRESERHKDRALVAERQTQEQLFDALLTQARGNALSHRPGQRFESLKTLAEATRLARQLDLAAERFLDLRSAAILALAVPDLYAGQTWDGHSGASAALDFDEDLAVYARTDERGYWEVRRVADNCLLHKQPGPTRAAGAFFLHLSRDGRFLVVLEKTDNRLQVWKLASAQSAASTPVLLLEEENVVSIDYHPNDEQLVVAHHDGVISLHGLDNGRAPGSTPLCRRLPPGAPEPRPMTLAVHPSKPLAAVGCGLAQIVQLRDLRDGAVLHTIRMPTQVSQLAWHPDGHTLAVSEVGGVDIHFVDSTSFQEVRTLHGGGRGMCLAFNRAGDRLAAYTWDHELQLFDLATDKLLFQTSTWMPARRLRSCAMAAG